MENEDEETRLKKEILAQFLKTVSTIDQNTDLENRIRAHFESQRPKASTSRQGLKLPRDLEKKKEIEEDEKVIFF